jgi:hypothetical protein
MNGAAQERRPRKKDEMTGSGHKHGTKILPKHISKQPLLSSNIVGTEKQTECEYVDSSSIMPVSGWRGQRGSPFTST